MNTNKLFYFFISLLGLFMLPSCDNSDDDFDPTWKNENEAAFEKIKTTDGYFEATIPGGPGSVYYKVLESTTDTKPPLYTSQIKVHYEGYLIDETLFESVMEPTKPFEFTLDGSSFYSKNLITGQIQSQTGITVIEGWRVALQNMNVGDKWEVWIPWQLGYGSVGKGSIPPYSTLVYIIKLEEIVKY